MQLSQEISVRCFQFNIGYSFKPLWLLLTGNLWQKSVSVLVSLDLITINIVNRTIH